MIHRLKKAWQDASLSAWNAGLIAVIISYAGPMTLILQAAKKGNLSPEMTISWVWAASICTGIITVVMSLTMRLPMMAAWSIPGSVLLITGLQRYDVQDLIGVYLLTGTVSVVLSITGVFSTIVDLVPSGVTNGILTGILLPICFRAVTASQDIPLMALLMLGAFLVTRRMASVFAVPVAMLTGIIVVLITGDIAGSPELTGNTVLAQPVWIAPSFNLSATLSIGLPLLLGTMAGQNLPGIDMMRSFGYRFNAKAALTACSVGGFLFAPFGLHGANLATVTGVVCAGPEAHPARRRRYVGGIAAGIFYIVAGTFAPVIVMLMTMISTSALALLSGLVLLPALNTALTTLLRRPNGQSTAKHKLGLEAGIVALVMTASDITALGITSPCWGLAAGMLVYLILGARPTRERKIHSASPLEQDFTLPHKQDSSSTNANAEPETVNAIGRK